MLDLNWYNTLIKPFLMPPPWVFAPAWAILYASIFVALILFTIKKSRKSKIKGYLYFILQMFFNILWTPTFFILNNSILALCIIIALDILAILNLKEFYRISKSAGLILIPYILWLIFATYLNLGIVILN